MAGSGFEWQRKPTQAIRVQRYVATVRNNIERQLTYYAARVEQSMKDGARWIDRTGNARQTLNSFVHVTPDGTIMLIAKQQMHYGLYLELSNAGRYAIVLPTLQGFYNPIWNDVKRVSQI